MYMCIPLDFFGKADPVTTEDRKRMLRNAVAKHGHIESWCLREPGLAERIIFEDRPEDSETSLKNNSEGR